MTIQLPPIAWTMFKAAPPVPKERWPEIVNRAVNHALDASLDTPRPGDEWVEWPESRVAACHDYAVTKREWLLCKGYRASELLLVFVKLADDRFHMVLEVVGAGVLDSLTDLIGPAGDDPKVIGPMRYEVVRRQSSDDPDVWIS